MSGLPVEPAIFDIISQRVLDWRRFGHLIGVADHKLNSIEKDNDTKDERLSECLYYKKRSSTHPIEWKFWKHKLLILNEGARIINVIEKRFSFLANSLNDNDDQDIDQEITILDIISQRVSDWRRFGQLIGVEDHILANIKKDNNTNHDRTNRCLYCKRDSSENPIEWKFWRNKLLILDEGVGIINVIEKRFPSLENYLANSLDNNQDVDQETTIFDIICQRVGNWRRFGRLIGVEDHKLNNIEMDNKTKHDRMNRSLYYKKNSTINQIEWQFWRHRLLILNEGEGIVNVIEKKIPPLATSLDNNDIENTNKGDDFMFLHIFDMISRRVSNWESFASALKISDEVLKEIKNNGKYKDYLEERVYRCINEKKASPPDWFYWRKILIEINEQDLVEDIEILYPELLNDGRIDLSDVRECSLSFY